ncbi:hypothetical protein T06_12872 [Trichinella sp. T6]|nr:hypothetical protein T06_12872 [Trichinella sp. T6]
MNHVCIIDNSEKLNYISLTGICGKYDKRIWEQLDIFYQNGICVGWV